MGEKRRNIQSIIFFVVGATVNVVIHFLIKPYIVECFYFIIVNMLFVVGAIFLYRKEIILGSIIGLFTGYSLWSIWIPFDYLMKKYYPRAYIIYETEVFLYLLLPSLIILILYRKKLQKSVVKKVLIILCVVTIISFLGGISANIDIEFLIPISFLDTILWVIIVLPIIAISIVIKKFRISSKLYYLAITPIFVDFYFNRLIRSFDYMQIIIFQIWPRIIFLIILPIVSLIIINNMKQAKIISVLSLVTIFSGMIIKFFFISPTDSWAFPNWIMVIQMTILIWSPLFIGFELNKFVKTQEE